MTKPSQNAYTHRNFISNVKTRGFPTYILDFHNTREDVRLSICGQRINPFFLPLSPSIPLAIEVVRQTLKRLDN